MAGRRAAAVAAGLVVLASSLVVPVLGSDPEPITPTVVTVPLAGVDAGTVAASAVAMASWEQGATEPLGLAQEASIVTAAVHDHGPSDHATEGEHPLEPVVATAELGTEPFGLLGITADEPLDGSRVLVRVRENGTWSAWQPLPVSGHGPDPASPEASGARFGTEPLLTDAADGVQVRIDAPGGEAPEGLALAMVDNPVAEADAGLAGELPIATAAAATATAGMPPIITRAQWGANEAMRRAGPRYTGPIKVGFVHHTASTNDYTPEEAAQQVRNLYGWYVNGLRYSDMAYNFLVDRFGRLYEGRAGGMDQPVLGGHTAGFNQESFAVAAIGNFQKKAPAPAELAAMTDSIGALMGWKMALSHRDPNGTSVLVSDSSAGTSKFAPGQPASTPVISGHRDIGSTSCPGQFLEPQLPAIRAKAASMMGVTITGPAVNGPVAWGSPDPLVLTATATAPMNWSLAITSRCGTVVRTLAGSQPAPGTLSIGWDKLDGNGQPVPPGTYTFTLTGGANGDDMYPWTGTGVVASAAGAPPDPCGPPPSFTLAGSGFGHGVGMSQWGAYAMAKAGRDAASIVTYYYSGTTVAPQQDDMDIKVNLLYQVPTAQLRSEALAGDGGGVEVTVGGNAVLGGPGDVFTFRAAPNAVGVTRTAGGQSTDLGTAPSVSVRWAGTRNPGGAGPGPTLANIVGPGGKLNSDGHRYRDGSVEVLPISVSGTPRLNVVNSVRVHDEYLKGISEVSSSWPDAAMQAQALAARTYALAKIGKGGIRKACACHVDDGGGPYADQTFTGWSKASSAKGDRWVAAVAATAASDTTGLAILQDGAPISAFYYSSSGGRTNASADVWGGSLPYAQSVDDPWSLTPENPNASWSVVVPQESMAKAFGVSGVWRVEVSERLPSGAAKSVRATLQDGSTKTISGSGLRSTLGLKSTWINAIDGQGGVPAGAPSAAPAAPQAVPPAATSAAPALAPTGVTMRIGPTLTPKAGTSMLFRGRVLGPKGVRWRVQRQWLKDGQWETIAKTRTTAKGRYKFRIKKMVPAGAKYTYRVVVVRKGAILLASDQQTITVKPRRP